MSLCTIIVIVNVNVIVKKLANMQVFLYLCSTMSNYKERGRMELAQLYFPQLGGIAAWKKLQHWINICQPLKDELRQLGYTGRQRTFTPKQVSRIVHYLGEY